MFIVLPEYDELFPKGSVQRVIDNFVNTLDLSEVEQTYKDGGTPPYHPSVLLKVVLYAYSRNIYGCRPISDLCARDLVCQWYLNFTKPSFNTINRFRTEHMGLERTLKVFGDLVRILYRDGLVAFEECTYNDGSTIQSRASSTKLVYVQTIRRYAEGNTEKINNILKIAREVQDLDKKDLAEKPETPEIKEGDPEDKGDAGSADNNDPVSENKEVADGMKSDKGKEKETEKETEKVKRGPEVHMSKERLAGIRDEIASGKLNLTNAQKKELEERIEKADRYRDTDEMCGDRSSMATTDPDSVAMHPKEDRRRTGPCLAMYNMQFMTQNQYVLWADIFDRISDSTAFPLFLESLPEEFTPAKMADDAGYGSTVNVLLAENRGILPFFKYALYDKESRPKFVASPYIAEYMPVLEDGSLQCPGGKLIKTTEKAERKNGISCTYIFYRTDQCAQCPHRKQCHGKNPKNYRIVKRCKEWTEIKPKLKERLDSEEGQILLRNRSKDIEPTFAHVKWAGDYRRFRHFGKEKCRTDLLFRLLAYNLNKYANGWKKRLDTPSKDGHMRSGSRFLRAMEAIWSHIMKILNFENRFEKIIPVA